MTKQLQVGDLVRLKPDHVLNEFIKGDCIITDVVKYNFKHRKTRYHIVNLEDCMTWVYYEELDLVSCIRDQKLLSIGI